MKMSEDGFFEDLDEPKMEIQIDTLMGTSFDMRVSSTDTIRDIKQRIQRVEGIPIHQQNLIFQSKELRDSRRLCDAGIKNGATIRLVVSMKGGPISTRRISVSYEHRLMIKELKELLESTRDEIGEKLAPGSKVSLLVFKEGDILNLLRVIENDDGSYSPYNEKPISPPARGSSRSQITFFGDKLVEDTHMMLKIANLRKKMEDISLKRQLRANPRTLEDKLFGESGAKANYSYKLLSDFHEASLSDSESSDENDIDVKIYERTEDEASNQSETEEIALKDKHRMKSGRKSIYAENKGAFSLAKQNYARIGAENRKASVLTRLVAPKSVPESIELEELPQTWEISNDRLESCKFGALVKARRQSVGFEEDDAHFGGFRMAAASAIPAEYAPKSDELCDYYFGGRGEPGRAPLYGRKTTEKDELFGYLNLGSDLVETGAVRKGEALPPVVVKKKSRCFECNRRLNITNIYNCRCGKIFCSAHRYSEVHRCSYDYKTEGRRILEHQNPLVTAEKVNRI